MRRYLAAFIIVTLLGCEAATTAYVITKTLIESRREYCDRTSDSVVKEAAIKAIRTKFPGYPKSGICTKLGQTHLEERDSVLAETKTGGR